MSIVVRRIVSFEMQKDSLASNGNPTKILLQRRCIPFSSERCRLAPVSMRSLVPRREPLVQEIWLRVCSSSRKAVSIDPQFPEAHANLAVHYSALRCDGPALLHAQIAFDLIQRVRELALMLTLFLTDTKHYEQAKTVARQTLKTQRDMPEASAALAISLIGPVRLQEAYEQFRLAAAGFPVARLLGANALMETGHPVAAEVQVRQYLRTSAHKCERARLERWIAARSKSETTESAAPGDYASEKERDQQGTGLARMEVIAHIAFTYANLSGREGSRRL
jgi:hypothetical protein